MQSVRQREQILRLILENEKVSWPRTFGRQTDRHSQTDRVRQTQPVTMSSDHSLYRLTGLLTSPALPWKQKASQEVTSERCVGTLHCCACGTLCTCSATGSSWTHPNLCVSAGTSKQWFPEVSLLFTCLSARLSLRLTEESVRSINHSDLQKSITKLKKSKSVGGVGVLLHAALD